LLASEVLKLVVRTLFHHQRKKARQAGVRISRANGQGAITFIQRFRSALPRAAVTHSGWQLG
jgi:hypothetical protein